MFLKTREILSLQCQCQLVTKLHHQISSNPFKYANKYFFLANDCIEAREKSEWRNLAGNSCYNFIVIIFE